MLYVAALSGLYNYILFRWMFPMVPASVMVTGHPRGKGRRSDLKMQFYCAGILFFFFLSALCFSSSKTSGRLAHVN